MSARQRKKKILERARMHHLDRLYAAQNSLCFWCKSQTAIVSNIPKENIISIKGCAVVWRDGKLTFSARVSTIDHVEPLRDGGDNGSDNLVMACADCNKDRTATRSEKPDVIRRVCPDCGGDKPPKNRRCRECYIAKARAWLAGKGWEEVPTNDGHSKWKDPATGTLHKLSCACAIAGADV